MTGRVGAALSAAMSVVFLNESIEHGALAVSSSANPSIPRGPVANESFERISFEGEQDDIARMETRAQHLQEVPFYHAPWRSRSSRFTDEIAGTEFPMYSHTHLFQQDDKSDEEHLEFRTQHSSLFNTFTNFMLRHLAGRPKDDSSTDPVGLQDQKKNTTSLRRILTSNAFDELNELFRGTLIKIPDVHGVQADLPWPLTSVFLDITNMLCMNLFLGDLQLSHEELEPNTFNLDIVLSGLGTDCTVDWAYKYDGQWGLVQGNGKAQTQARDSSVNLKISARVTIADDSPPVIDAGIENCEAGVVVSYLHFSEGGLSGAIFNADDEILRNTIQSELSRITCDELQGIDVELNGLLASMTEMIEPYMQSHGRKVEKTEELIAEEALSKVDANLVDFTEGGTLLNLMLKQADKVLGGGSGTPEEVGINSILRTSLLDSDGYYIVKVPEITVYEGHDVLTESKVTLTSAKLSGLDTFTVFDPLNVRSKQTLYNRVQIQKLEAEVGLRIDTKPSTKCGSVIVEGSTPHNIEDIVVNVSVGNVDAELSLLLAVDQDALGMMQLGSMLLLPPDLSIRCFLDKLVSVDFTQVTAEVQEIRSPTLTGFIDEGVDRVLTDATQAAFDMLKPVILKAIPGFFQTSGKVVLNDILKGALESTADSSSSSMKCLDYSRATIPGGRFVDFRDFLLKPERAAILGGSGESPYGSFMPTAMEMVKERVLGININTGMSHINDILVGPMTTKYSNTRGTISMGEEHLYSLLVQSSALPEYLSTSDFEVRAQNLLIHNLDSVGTVAFMEPKLDHAHVVKNFVSIGTHSKAVTGEVSLDIAYWGRKSEVEVQVEMDDVTVDAAVLAKIGARALYSFPVKDMVNPFCWLATIPMAHRVNEKITVGLDELEAHVDRLKLRLVCANCTAGMKELSVLVSMLENKKVVPTLAYQILNGTVGLIRSDFGEHRLQQLLQEAEMRCPHEVMYNESLANEPFQLSELLRLPTVPREYVEVGIVGFFILAQSMGVILSTDYPFFVEEEKSKLLSAQQSLVVSEGAQLIDFQELLSTKGLFNSTLNMIFSKLGGLMQDPLSLSTPQDLGINILVRNFLNDERMLDFPINGLEFGTQDVNFALRRLRIFGLDTFDTFDMFDAIGAQTIKSQICLRTLEVELQVGIIVSNVQGKQRRRALGEPVEEIVSFRGALKDFRASTTFLLAMNLARLMELKLGSILSTGKLFLALLSGVEHFEVIELNVNVGEIEKPLVEGFVSESLSETLAAVTDAIFERYHHVFLRAVPGLFARSVKRMINGYAGDFLGGQASVFSSVSSGIEGTNFVDFRDLLLKSDEAEALGGSGESPYGDLFSVAKGFLDDQILKLDPQTGFAKLYDIVVAPLTQSLSDTPGTLKFEEKFFSHDSKFDIPGLTGRLEIAASDALIDNIDTIGHTIHLLDPRLREPYVIDNLATIGSESRPVHARLRLIFSIEGNKINMRNEVDLGVAFHLDHIFASVMAMVNETALMEFPLRDAMSPHCWFATIPAPKLNRFGVRDIALSNVTAALEEFKVHFAHFQLKVDCIECSSPGLRNLSSVLSGEHSIEETTNMANRLLDHVSSLLEGDFLQDRIDRFLAEAEKKCPHSHAYEPEFSEMERSPFASPGYTDSTGKFMIAVVIVLFSCIMLVIGLIVSVRWVSRRNHTRWLHGLPFEDIRRLYSEQVRRDQQQSMLNLSTRSLFFSTQLPCLVRWGMPCIIMASIALFVSGHLSLGASVTVGIEVAGQDMTIDKFFEFSLAKSVFDIWEAGAKALAVLILFFSGLWPYTKQLVTLFLWFAPTSWVSVQQRGKTLAWLDVLAKWSMVDIFVLIVTMAGFRVSVESPTDQAFYLIGIYSVQLLVVPLWGLYANMTAQLVSQISSHLVIHYHRRIVASGIHNGEKRTLTGELPPENGSEASNSITSNEIESSDIEEQIVSFGALREHVYQVESKSKGSRELRVRRGVNIGVGVAGTLAASLLFSGCVVPSFRLDILGLVGLAVELGQAGAPAFQEHSLFTIVGVIMEEARYLDVPRFYVGLGCLAALIVLTSLIVPLLQISVIMYLWYAPVITRKKRIRLILLMEILEAWQYVGVFIISIFIATWQLGGVSAFMMNDVVGGSLDSILGGLVYYGLLKPDDAQSFYVKASIQGGAYLLVVGAILLTILKQFVMRAEKQRRNDLHRLLQQANARCVEQATTAMQDDQGECSCDYVDEANNCEAETMARKVRPVPLRFTDCFRWLLVPSTLPPSLPLPQPNHTVEDDDDVKLL